MKAREYFQTHFSGVNNQTTTAQMQDCVIACFKEFFEELKEQIKNSSKTPQVVNTKVNEADKKWNAIFSCVDKVVTNKYDKEQTSEYITELDVEAARRFYRQWMKENFYALYQMLEVQVNEEMRRAFILKTAREFFGA